MRVMCAVLAAAAQAMLGGCALVQSVRDETVSGFCGARNDDRPRWARIDAPANADLYRALARSEEQPAHRRAGDEYWFALPTGELKYCLTALRRASTIPERNGDGCDDRIAVWWVFRQTEAGPATDGAEERICLL